MEKSNALSVESIVGPIKLPLKNNNSTSEFTLYFFRFSNNERWIAAYIGDVFNGEEVTLRIESACIFGHVFHSDKCDCGYQLDAAIEQIANKKHGLILYGIDQDARGLGIESHFKIYDLRQNKNFDTDEVYSQLGADVDVRDYEPVVMMLNHFKVKNINLLSNNIKRRRFLTENGFTLTNSPLQAPLNINNMATLMLEKEDLDYDLSYKTHADWLERIQGQVKDNLEVTGFSLIRNNNEIVEEYIDHDRTWSLASYLNRNYSNLNDCILYLTDLPRLEELWLYKELGISIIVVPFADIPDYLLIRAKKLGIHLQDWERKNKYDNSRIQWNLKWSDHDIYVYQKENKTRVCTNKNFTQLNKIKESVSRSYTVNKCYESESIKENNTTKDFWFEISFSSNKIDELIENFNIVQSVKG